MGQLIKTIQTIMSQALKETSTKVQRPGNEANDFKIKASNFPQERPTSYGMMIWPGLSGDAKSWDKKPDRFCENKSLK